MFPTPHRTCFARACSYGAAIRIRLSFRCRFLTRSRHQAWGERQSYAYKTRVPANLGVASGECSATFFSRCQLLPQVGHRVNFKPTGHSGIRIEPAREGPYVPRFVSIRCFIHLFCIGWSRRIAQVNHTQGTLIRRRVMKCRAQTPGRNHFLGRFGSQWR